MKVQRSLSAFLFVLFLLEVSQVLCQQSLEGSEVSPLFELLPPEQTGITCVNALPEGRYRNIIVYQYYYNGGGVGIGDVNGDGLPDIVITQNTNPNKLYLNKGNFQFKDVTAEAGLKVPSSPSWTTGVAMADVNQDGKLDIYMSRSGKLRPENRRNLLFINQGNNPEGTPIFSEQAEVFGLDDSGYSVQTAFLDYDKDGDLDAYIMNHGTGFFTQPPSTVFTDKDSDRGDKLLENQGGKYVEVTEKAGIKSTAIGYGLGVAIEDVNKDGWPDIYVSNDFFEHDYLYINQQDGTFQERIKTATGHISNYSMGNDAADINNDGWADIMVLDMAAEDNRRLKANMSGMNPQDFYQLVESGFHHQYMFNTLHLNRGNESFADIAQLAGVASTDWSWAPLLADFDNDGWKDMYVTNGLRKDVRNTDFQNAFQDMIQKASLDPSRKDLSVAEWRKALTSMPSEKISNYAYQNQRGSGLQFENVTNTWGLNKPGFSNGAAYGDLDGDGDLDLVVSNLDEPPFVYRNTSREQNKGNYLRLRLSAGPQNVYALGARIEARVGEDWQYYSSYFVRGFQSSVEPVVHIGLGKADKVDELKVVWPDGSLTRIKNVSANQSLALKIGGSKSKIQAKKNSSPIFRTVAEKYGLTFTHRENAFDDFEREILLPHQMSRLGPFLAAGDINSDGREDVFVGGAKGQSGKIFIQQADKTFIASSDELDEQYEDMGAAFFDANGDGHLDLYVVSGGNELPDGDALYQDRLYLNDGEGKMSIGEDLLPEITSSGSVVLPFDLEGDGDVDLFIGGRQRPGEYPLPGKSMILENQKGRFVNTTLECAPLLEEYGMITAALLMDIDRDDDLDLLTAGEWTAIQVWENQEGQLRPSYSLPNSRGWWYSLAIADVDRDGDPDLIAGNLGLNYKYKASKEEPFSVHAADFDEDGSRDIVLSYYQQGNQYPLRGRSCSSAQMPLIKKKFPTYNEFAVATLEEVYGEFGLSEAVEYEAETFASHWYENLGNGQWKSHLLPDMAQLSSINGIVPVDVNGDKKIDLILGGNLYVSEVETTRNDAGSGLVLLGDGKGNFEPLSIVESGLFIPGDVKDLLMINENLLLVTNNDGELEVFELTK